MSTNNENNKKEDLEVHFKHSDFQEKIREENKAAISKLVKICCFCFTFMTIEFIGGYIAGSLAVMTDAAHLLSDLAGFLISMFSLFIATRPANPSLTYGYHRSEVIGALSSILIIWVLTIWLITEAIDRIFHPREIIGLVMMGIATCGLKDYNENEIQEDLQSPLLEGEEYNENEKNKTDANPVIRAAYIHIIGDMIQSLGVLIAAVTIYLLQDTHPGIRIFDPICTFIFAIIVLCTTIPVSSDCLNVLMEAAPKNIDIKRLYYELQKVVGVVNVHDIHIWNISIGRPSISLHILSDLPQKTLEQATLLCKKYGIHHCTIQVEDNTQIKRLSFIACDHEHENDIH